MKRNHYTSPCILFYSQVIYFSQYKVPICMLFYIQSMSSLVPCVCRGTISEHSCRKISQNKEAPERARALPLVYIKWTLSKKRIGSHILFSNFIRCGDARHWPDVMAERTIITLCSLVCSRCYRLGWTDDDDCWRRQPHIVYAHIRLAFSRV